MVIPNSNSFDYISHPSQDSTSKKFNRQEIVFVNFSEYDFEVTKLKLIVGLIPKWTLKSMETNIKP